MGKKKKFRGFVTQGGKAPVVQHIEVNWGEALSRWNPRDCSGLMSRIEKKRGSTVVCLVYNDAPPTPCVLSAALLEPLRELLSGLGRARKLDLFLRTTGGRAEVPWMIISLLREFSEELGVIVPHLALSGGTHIAIAADELVLTPFSLLGSVDPTRQHPLLPSDPKGNRIPTSVQDLKHCIQFIREQLGESYPNQNLALVISELFKYVNPLAIGALEQSYALSRLITKKALKSRNKPPSDTAIEKIQDMLGGGYFSHSFPISRREVETDLELPVTKPDQELLDLIDALHRHYNDEFARAAPATQDRPYPTFKVGAFVQSRGRGYVIGQLLKEGQFLADKWLTLPSREVQNAN